jgi:Tfp pilus assembly protein PilZ
MLDNVKPKKELRRNPREACLFDVSFIINNRSYQGYICNMSRNGLYIETKGNFIVSQKATLTFSHPKSVGNIKMTGSIVRVTDKGIAVKIERE